MDTKQKSRSADGKRQSQPAARQETEKRRREADAPERKREAARRPASQAPRKAPAQQKVPAEDRRSDQTRRRQQNVRPPEQIEKTAKPARPVESSAEEMVFRPAEQQSRQQRADPQAAKRTQMRRRSAQRTQERKQQLSRRKNRPAVVYTQPKPFNLNRLLLQLAVVLAVVLAVTVGLSVFFKVEKVVVYGNKAYSAWTVQEASGLEGGENLLTFGRTRACGKITTALPYVKNARIGINLPDTVNIYIEEYDVAYAIQSQDGIWWLMTSGGKITEQIDGGTAGSYTKVLGVELDSPTVGEAAKAVEVYPDIGDVTEASDATDSTAPVVVTGAERLNAALLILTSLETNDIVGEVASVDVSSLNNIELWYGQRYQVKVGDTSQMDKKLSWMKQVVSQRNDYDMGILDVSFTTWTDMVGYTPFE